MSTQFSDDFNRANAANLGANYTSLGNPFTIVSNQAAAPAASGSDYVNAATPGAACWARINAAVNVAAANYLGLGLRLNTGSFNGYYAAWDTGGLTIYRIDGGTPTALGATGLTPPANGTDVYLEMRGSTLRVFYGSALQASRTDATYSAAGSVLLLGAGTAARFDGLSLGTLPTLSSPTPSGTLGTNNSATIGATTDEAAGTLYVVVDTASLAGITEAQIIAGQDAGGAAADASGNATVSTTTPSVGVTGLLSGTAYNYAVLQVSGGYSNIVTGTFTTGGTAAPSITGTSSATPAHGSQLTVTGAAFGASQGTRQLRVGGTVQPVSSWADGAIVIKALSIGLNSFGAPLNVELWDGGSLISNSYSLTGGIVPQAGWDYRTVATPNPNASLRVQAVADLTSGCQVQWNTMGGLVEMFDDLTFSADDSIGEFEVQGWRTGDGWGLPGTQIIDLGRPNPRLLEHLLPEGVFVADEVAAYIQLVEALGPFGSTGRLKVWDGSAWGLKPIKVWDGSAWTERPLKVWNGSAWV